MKAKSRKRLLISSVVMLLVAMLALGTATFAWFTQSTTATATGIAVRTSKTSSLEISDDTIAYTSQFTYGGYKTIMLPASSADGTDWYSTFAGSPSNYARTDAAITPVTADATHADYVFCDQLNIKNAAASGGQAVSDIQITISGISNNFVRVALVPVASKGTDVALPANAQAFSGYKAFSTCIYADNSANSARTNTAEYLPIATVSGAGAIASTAITPTQTSTGSVTITSTDVPALASLAAQGELHFNLYVWFEGQDTDCYDGNAGNGIHTNGLSFSVTGTPVAETND